MHQIELELQNEGLLRTQEALETARSRYLDLYDLVSRALTRFATDCEASSEFHDRQRRENGDDLWFAAYLEPITDDRNRRSQSEVDRDRLERLDRELAGYNIDIPANQQSVARRKT
ncbi:hypothetical protein [Thiocapsa sp.]|uniref:hypothetical protein n=1 Tax=Thiocapsa sp. TaxID=2024551 RepID=UPI0025D18504|nr:hypothetical protein [Thiocapsa sp.]